MGVKFCPLFLARLKEGLCRLLPWAGFCRDVEACVVQRLRADLTGAHGPWQAQPCQKS